MNSRNLAPSRPYRSAVRDRRFCKGQSSAELAVAMLVLSVLVLVTSDFGRMFYTQITVDAAARAGVQYGSQSLVNAADTSGITSAVANDSSNITQSSGSPTVSQCTCISSSTTVAQCSSSYHCSDNPGATYVTVTVSAPFTTLGVYPGLPNPVTLTGTAEMQVMQ
jgi:Flp pilus assembly protein TadG